MGKVIMSGKVPKLVAPSTYIALADMAEGSIVKLSENGSPVEFYVAMHNYEPSLNGTGRTLLVRKDCYDKRIWRAAPLSQYAESDLHKWFNNTYKLLFDADVQELMGTTYFRYTKGYGDSTVATMSSAVFALSVTEYGRTYSYANTEGSALPTASILRTAKYSDGTSATQWTRTPYNNYTDTVCCLGLDGSVGINDIIVSHGSRPAFTLPSTAQFDEETLEFKGVA